MKDWYLQPIKKTYIPIKPSRRKYKTDAKRLKFCELCNMVWEWVHTSAACFRYEDFPTIGLERKECTYCKKKKKRSKK